MPMYDATTWGADALRAAQAVRVEQPHSTQREVALAILQAVPSAPKTQRRIIEAVRAWEEAGDLATSRGEQGQRF